MTGEEARAITVEREMPHPPEKVWRALTQPHLIAEWLMRNDFRPELHHRFSVSAEWGAVDCEVRAIEPNRLLSYSWDTKDLRSIITFTLEPTQKGTRLRMEQTGFRAGQEAYYRGATIRWPQFIATLEEVAGRLD